MLKTNNLSLQFGHEVLFQDLNISLDSRSGKKVALVGRNGCGKSSLLKIINGDIKQTDGVLALHDESIGYLPQELDLRDRGMVGEYLESKVEESWMDYKIDTVLSSVGLEEDYIIKNMAELSGGEKVKVFLAGLLLDEPTVLLLDEPTNNLDRAGVEWLEDFVKNFKGSVITVSHDRYLINRTADHIWEIDPDTKGLIVYEGNYDSFLVEKKRLYDKKLMEYKNLDRQIEELSMWIRIHEFHPKYRFSGIVGAKKEKYARLKKYQKDRPVSDEKLKIKNMGSKKRGLALKVDVVSKCFGQNQILKNLSFVMHAEDRLLVQGKNGSGKTTLLNIINGDDKNFDGDIVRGENVEIGYLRQFSDLDKTKSILKVFEEKTRIIEPESRRVLAKYSFGVDRVKSGVATLSFGQRKRLDLAIILALEPDLLILDEPTNHLDIYTREEFESFILDASLPMIIVSHDRYFVEKIGLTEVVNLG